jgi:hypothetical protein
MTTDQLMHAIENAWSRELPGRSAIERDAVLRDLRRLIEARDREPCRRAPVRLRVVSRE